MADIPESTKMKACPHCGKEDTFVERSDYSACHVVCNECGARGPVRCDENEADAAASEEGDAEPGEMAARRAWNTRAAPPAPIAEGVTCVAKPLSEDERKAAIDKWMAPPAMDREAVDFLHQLRRVNSERYQVWASRPLMLCEHCGASEHVETERCAPPFSVQPHSFTKPHLFTTVENDAGMMFDALELGGEVGELLNVVKKLERKERGWRGSRADFADFADECADVLICLDKLARRRGVDLIAATTAKFNATSDKVGLPHKLSTLSADAIRQGEGSTTANSPVVPDGWKLVPIEPTPEMRQAAIDELSGPTDFSPKASAWDAIRAYRAMLAATPASHASDGGKA